MENQEPKHLKVLRIIGFSLISIGVILLFLGLLLWKWSLVTMMRLLILLCMFQAYFYVCLVFLCLGGAIVCNNLFRAWWGWEPNYFYLYNHKGTPLAFLYNVIPTSTYGWFSINWLYTGALVGVFLVVYLLLFLIAKKISKED